MTLKWKGSSSTIVDRFISYIIAIKWFLKGISIMLFKLRIQTPTQTFEIVPLQLAAVHLVLHISFLKKCMGNMTSIVPLESVNVKDTHT